VPLEPQSANLIIAPLSLHLTNDTPGVFIQIRRALRPDGLFLAAIPGSGTLQELREVLLATEVEMTGGASPRVIPFADVRDVGGLMQRAGFRLPVIDAETYTVRYDSIFPLMRDLRAMGMANPLAAAQPQAAVTCVLPAGGGDLCRAICRSGRPHSCDLLDHLRFGMGAA
jgi:SAM-dependent methyltransferase